MNDTNKVALATAIAAGYALGRTRKAKLALTVGTYLAGRRFKLSPQELVSEGVSKLRETPQFSALSDQVRGDLLTAGRSALTAAADRQFDSLADSLRERTSLLSSPRPEEDEESEGRTSTPRRTTTSRTRTRPGTRTTRAMTRRTTRTRSPSRPAPVTVPRSRPPPRSRRPPRSPPRPRSPPPARRRGGRPPRRRPRRRLRARRQRARRLRARRRRASGRRRRRSRRLRPASPSPRSRRGRQNGRVAPRRAPGERGDGGWPRRRRTTSRVRRSTASRRRPSRTWAPVPRASPTRRATRSPS